MAEEKESGSPSETRIIRLLHSLRPAHWLFLGAVVGGICAVIAAIITALAQCDDCCPACPGLPTATPPPLAAYSFELGTEGWLPETNSSDVLACTNTAWSDKQAKDGTHSLELTMNLSDTDGYNKGEAYVDLGTPIDLTNQTITISVYAPTGSSGDPKHLNGFQVFVKDTHPDWHAEYGCWNNIQPATENTWREITLTVTAADQDCPGWYKDPSFDPTHIRAIGVKMGAGRGSGIPYQGSIFVDAVSYTGEK